MLLTLENRNIRRRTCSSANYSTTDLICTELGRRITAWAMVCLQREKNVRLYEHSDLTYKEY
jgi:hypothetical protein